MNRRALRLLITALSTAALALGSATAAAAAAAGPGEISVTLLASDTGSPIAGGCVSIYDADGFGPLASACGADAAGVITVGGLTDGTPYKVFVDGNDSYLGEWLFGLDDSFDAALITAPADVTASLRVAVPAGGTLTRTDGSPVDQAGVSFDDPVTGNSVFRTSTGPDGTWNLQVAAGTYQVRFNDPLLGDYWATGRQDMASADPITAVAGTPLVVDDTLPLPGGAAGRVVSSVDGTALAGLCAIAAPAADPTSGIGTPCATTSATGRYRIPNLRPGTSYVVLVTDPAANWAAKVSAPFSATAGVTTAVPRLALTPGAAITGVLVDAATRAPLRGVCVDAFLAGAVQSFVGTTSRCTDATGRWRVKGLPAGRVQLRLGGDATHPAVWAPLAPTQETATKYLVTPGRTTGTGTVAEPLGGSLAGRILGPDGAGVPNVFVSVGGRHPGRAGAGEGQYVGVTDATGRYVIRNLPQWNVPVVVYPGDQPLGVRWSGGATDPAKAKPVALLWNTRTTFGLKLQPEARLAVTVTGTAGSTDVLVDPVGSDGSVIGFGNDLLGGDGTTTVAQLPGGAVRLRLTLFPSNRVFYYDAATTVAGATPIPTTAGATSTVTVAVPPA